MGPNVYTRPLAGDYLLLDWPLSQTESLWQGTPCKTRQRHDGFLEK